MKKSFILIFALLTCFNINSAAALCEPDPGGPGGPGGPGDGCNSNLTYQAQDITVNTNTVDTIIIGDDEILMTGTIGTATYINTGQPDRGHIFNNNNGTFTFNPNSGFSDLPEGQTRVLTFGFNVTDSDVETDGGDDGVVTINVTKALSGSNDFTANSITLTTTESAVIVIGDDNSEKLLQGTASSPVYEISQPSKGVLSNNHDGSFTFNPNGAFDSLTDGESESIIINYTISDASSAPPAAGTITLTVQGSSDNNGAMTLISTVFDDARTADNQFNPGESVALKIYISELEAGGKIALSNISDKLKLLSSKSLKDQASDYQGEITGTFLQQTGNVFTAPAEGTHQNVWLQLNYHLSVLTEENLSDITLTIQDKDGESLGVKTISLPTIKQETAVNVNFNKVREGKFVLTFESDGFAIQKEDSLKFKLSNPSSDTLDCANTSLDTEVNYFSEGKVEVECLNDVLEINFTGADLVKKEIIYIPILLPNMTDVGDVEWQVITQLNRVDEEPLEITKVSNLVIDSGLTLSTKNAREGDTSDLFKFGLVLPEDWDKTVELNIQRHINAKFHCATLQIKNKLKIEVLCSEHAMTVIIPQEVVINNRNQLNRLVSVRVSKNRLVSSGSDDLGYLDVAYNIKSNGYNSAEKSIRTYYYDSLGLFAALLSVLFAIYYLRRKKLESTKDTVIM